MGTNEYVRELIRQDKERRLGDLEANLIAAARGPKIELTVAEIRRKGLVRALRERGLKPPLAPRRKIRR